MMKKTSEMNERIAVLAAKASDTKTGWLDRQKFAELIIRECVRAASTTPEMRKSGAPERIKEVLGVE